MKLYLYVSMLLLAGLLLAVAAPCAELELDYGQLEGSLNQLSYGDRDAVDDAIDLLKSGEHSLALARLSALNKSNPKSSSLRILASYALLLAGNVSGAFEEAEMAHDAPDGNAYRCWFLAKVALLNGKMAVCEREVEHLKEAGTMAAEVREIENEMASQ